MLGQIVFIAGASSILAVSFWSEAAAYDGVDNKAGLFATVLAIVIAGLGTRFLWLAGRTEILLLECSFRGCARLDEALLAPPLCHVARAQ